jgi:hypothetical protein
MICRNLLINVQVSIARASCGYSSDATNDASVHLTQANMAYRMTGQTGSLCYMAPEVPPLLLLLGRLSVLCFPRVGLPEKRASATWQPCGTQPQAVPCPPSRPHM